MNKWKEQFLNKLSDAQGRHETEFEQALDDTVVPAFEDLGSFLGDNGFQISTPLRESGRRSFKFELSENAYVLLIFRFSGIGEFEVRTETFVPGREPMLEKSVGRVSDVSVDWAQASFQKALDAFVEMLADNDASNSKGKRKSANVDEEEELVIA